MTEFYEKLSENLQKDTLQKYNKFLKKHLNMLTKKELVTPFKGLSNIQKREIW